MEAIWYVVGFAVAGVSFVFLTIAASWLLALSTRAETRTETYKTIGDVKLDLRPLARRQNRASIR